MRGAILRITIDKEGTQYGPRVQAFQCDSSPQCFAWRCGFGDFATLRLPIGEYGQPIYEETRARPRFIVSRFAGVYEDTAGAPVAETTCPAIPKPGISILARPQVVFLQAQSHSKSILLER